MVYDSIGGVDGMTLSDIWSIRHDQDEDDEARHRGQASDLPEMRPPVPPRYRRQVFVAAMLAGSSAGRCQWWQVMAKHTQRHRLAGDIATAATTAAGGASARFVKPTSSNMLVDVAKRLQRLQTRGARLRKESKRNDADIRAAKRELKALAQHIGRSGDL